MSCDRTYGDGLYGDCYYGGAEPLIPGYVQFPGTSGNRLVIADSAELDITGDICIVARVALDDWSPPSAADTIVSKRNSSITGAYRFDVVSPTGPLRFIWSPDGTDASLVAKNSSVPTGIPDGSFKWVAVTFDVDNGAGGNSVRFWLSDDGVTWTQLGATITTAGVTSIAATTASLEIGTTTNGVNNFLHGKVSYVSIRNGIGVGGTVGGSEVFRFDAETDLAVDPAVTSFPAFTGQTILVQRSGITPTTIVPTILGDCTPCFSNEGCPEQVPAASGPRDRFFDLVPCSPGGEC